MMERSGTLAYIWILTVDTFTHTHNAYPTHTTPPHPHTYTHTIPYHRELTRVVEEVTRVNGMFSRRDPLRKYMDVLIDTLRTAGVFVCLCCVCVCVYVWGG